MKNDREWGKQRLIHNHAVNRTNSNKIWYSHGVKDKDMPIPAGPRKAHERAHISSTSLRGFGAFSACDGLCGLHQTVGERAFVLWMDQHSFSTR